MRIAVVGAGRVGTALAVLLGRAGHAIVAVAGGEATRERVSGHLPGVPVVPPTEAASAAELVLIATPDDAIAGVCAALAAAGSFRAGQWVGHVSGLTGLDALEPARGAGAGVFSLHPLQTFPSVEAALDRIPGCAVAVTAGTQDGLELGERLAADVGARPFRLADEAKPLYHAAAVFASNFLVATSGVAERLFREAGLDDPVTLFAPLLRATAENVRTLGPERALTGPAVRGDAGTILRHLEVLNATAPEAVRAYVTLTRVCLDLAVRSGRLDEAGRARVDEVLAPWT